MIENMEWLTHPFSLGLGVGLLVAVILWLNGLWRRRTLVKECRTLKEHLHTQMQITARGNDSTQRELEELRSQNENLRITNATLNQKPGRAEWHTLVVYDKAIHRMHESAPGFGPAWENALKAAEAEIRQTEKGLLPLMRKVFRPSLAAQEITRRRLTTGDSPSAAKPLDVSEPPA